MAMDPRQGVKDEFTERDVRLSCSLCMERYKGRNPKILPCFHTFCLPCLVSLEASATTAASGTPDESDDLKGSQTEKKVGVDENGGGCGGDTVAVGGADGGKAVFLCPTCRAPVSVPKGGVSALQTNFYIAQEQSADEASPPALCDMCEEGNQQPATHHCQQCQIGICRSCRRYHDKLMPKHHVAAAGPGQRGNMEKEKEEEKKGGLCLVHRDQVLCFHCRQCEVSMCLHCKLTLHEGHDSVDLAAAALKAKKEMSSLLTLTQQQLQVLESSIQRVDREDRQLTRHTEQAAQRINARHESLVAWAQDARDQLMEEVKAKEASSRTQLAAEKSSTTLVRDSLFSLLTRASHAVSTDPADVIMVKNELKEALLPDEKLDGHRKRAERDDPPWGWDYDELDASVLHADDVKVYMGRVAKGPDLGVGKPPVSLRELANRVDRWMTEMTETTSSMTTQLTSCTNDVTALQKKEAEVEQKLKSVDDGLTASKQTQDDLQGKVERLTTDAQKKFSSLSDNISTQNKSAADLQKTTQSLKKKMETSGKMISFIAKGLNTEKTKDGAPIVFSSAEVNDGGCYDMATGYFTVTIPGCYMFTSSIGSRGDKDTVAKAYIVVDSHRYTYIRGSYTSVGCGSISVQLRKGQKVCVRADCSPSCYCDGEVWFSGALVQPQL